MCIDSCIIASVAKIIDNRDHAQRVKKVKVYCYGETYIPGTEFTCLKEYQMPATTSSAQQFLLKIVEAKNNMRLSKMTPYNLLKHL